MQPLRAHPKDPAPFRSELLLAEANGVEGASTVGLFPRIEREWLREVTFALTYKQHGGSGLNFSLSEVLDLDFGDMLWFLERLNEQRASEARAIREQSRPRR